MTNYVGYQSVEVPPSLEARDEIVGRRAKSRPRALVAAVGILVTATAIIALSVFSSDEPNLWYSDIIIRVGSQHHDEHHHHQQGGHHETEFTKIIVITKDTKDTDKSQHGKKNQVEINNDDKKEVTPFDERAGEIGGHVDVNKTCVEAFSTPTFRDFGNLFNLLVGMNASQLDNDTWSFDFCGYSSVEWVSYNEAAMHLDVIVVAGFDVFKAFHEVFAFEESPKQAHGCRIHRKQYIILADEGPVTWEDWVAAGKDEMTALYNLLGP